jgi:hypothetical protein
MFPDRLSGAPGASVQLGQIHARPREASLQPASQVPFTTRASPHFVRYPSMIPSRECSHFPIGNLPERHNKIDLMLSLDGVF